MAIHIHKEGYKILGYGFLVLLALNVAAGLIWRETPW
jgi:hypothetical protein